MIKTSILALAIGLLMTMVGVACQLGGQPVENSMLEPGDEINGMTLTTGAMDAPPLRVFCLPPVEDTIPITVDCNIPPLPKLAIGYVFGAADEALQTLDGSELTWELFLDDQLVDLQAFGTYDFVFPDLAKSPSPVREVFRTKKIWDLVLENPTPELHTMMGSVEAGAETYTWMIRFAVARSFD